MQNESRTHVLLDQDHIQQIKNLKNEVGSISAAIRMALDQYLPELLQQVSVKEQRRRRQTELALELQQQRAITDKMERDHSMRLEDFR